MLHQQTELEHIVGQMHHRRPRNRQRQGEKQGKHRRQQSAQAKARKQRQPGSKKGGEADPPQIHPQTPKGHARPSITAGWGRCRK